jgi:hypothetical protein
MENQSQALNDELLPQVRTIFLTVLCVLTFIGSTLGIFKGLTTVAGASKVAIEMHKNMDAEKQKEERQRLSEKNDGGSKFALKMMDSAGQLSEAKIKQTGIASIIASLLTLTGAILMWRLNRTGFYIYIAGIVLDVAAPFFIYGSDSFLAIMNSVFTGFVGLVFIIMYAFNVRDMKPIQRAIT